MEQVKILFSKKNKGKGICLIPGQMSIRQLKTKLIKIFFLAKNRELISELSIIEIKDNNLTISNNLFAKQYDDQDAYKLLSKYDKCTIIFKDIRYDFVHINVYDINENYSIDYPLKLENDYEEIKKKIIAKRGKQLNIFHMFTNDGSQIQINKDDDIKMYCGKELNAFLFPINAIFSYQNEKGEFIYSNNDSIESITNSIQSFFNLKTDNFSICVNDKIIDKDDINIHDVLKRCKEEPVLFDIILKSDIDKIKNIYKKKEKNEIQKLKKTIEQLKTKVINKDAIIKNKNAEIANLNEVFKLLNLLKIFKKKAKEFAVFKTDEHQELPSSIIDHEAFSNVSKVSAANFNNIQVFAFLISLIIDKSAELIENRKAALLCDHFCKESDVITILDAILAMNTNEHNEIFRENEVNFKNSGISKKTLKFFYIAISNKFYQMDESKGREAVINSIIWSKEQPGGTMAMIDEYIKFFNNDNFLNVRKATFEYIVGVGTKSEPVLVYKANDALNFDPSDENAFIKYSQRPGCIGLQSPGNIIAIKIQFVESIRQNRCILMHRDPSVTENINLGVISHEVKSFLNSSFFVALFESYWNDNPIINDIIPIYHSNKTKDETGFLIHINESNKKTYISYCPKSPDVINKMNESIQFLSSLMPFVPRSVVCKSDVPLCAVEIVSYGTSRNYETFVYLIDKPEKPKPNAYQLNKQILDYAVNKIDELRKTSPKIRFSITGESVYYKFNNKRQIEADFRYPNANQDIKSVFNPSYSSHLVLLIDSDYSDLPAIPSIPWILNDDTIKDNKIEDDDINKIIDLSNRIINNLGSANRSADLFFITLDNGFPSAKKEEIPDYIKNQIEFDEDDRGAIKQGIHQLVQQITTKTFRSGNLTFQIPLKNLSSTDHCTRYTTQESQNNACEQIKSIISSNFELKNDNINVIFIGPSMICISINNLHPKRTSHPPPDNIWDDSYHPCEIDNQLLEILKNNSIPATSVTHEPTIEIKIYHFPRFNNKKIKFEQKVNDIADQFGFLNFIKPSYEKDDHDEKTETSAIGSMTIGLFGKNSWARCVTLISKQFPSFDDFENTISISSMRSFSDNHLVSLIKIDEEEEAKRIKQQVCQEKMKTTCFLSCGMDEPELLPQYLYVNEVDGSVTQFGICKKCAKELLENYDDIKYVYNPVKHLVDYDRLKKLPNSIKGFDLIPQEKNGKDEWWPQIPLGQMAWTLMSDPNDELISFVKAWFTIAIEYAIQNSGHFMFCPDHPQIPIVRSNDIETVKCSVCDMIFCKDCNSWHKMGDSCYDGLINSEVKRCPGCHLPGIRYTGCDHMTCPRCECEWNYQTGAKMK